MAQAVLLAAPEISNTLQQQKLLMRPEVQKMSKLDELISETLARSDISDDEKYELYNAALSDFRKVQNTVLRQGAMLSSPADLFPRPLDPTLSSTPKDEMFKAIAELFQNLKEDGQTPILKTEMSTSTDDINAASSSISIPPTASKTMKKNESSSDGKMAAKLMKELKRDKSFNKDLLDKHFTDRRGNFDADLWKRTLEFLTDEKMLMTKVPADVLAKSEKLYNFMVRKGIDVSSWTKKFPLFASLVTSSKISPRKNKRGQKGRGFKNVVVNWTLWDKFMKKNKK